MNENRAVRIATAFACQAAAAPAARLCIACVEVLHVWGAHVTLMSGTHSGPVCSCNDWTSELQDLQYTLGEGPCQEAFNSDEPVVEPDLESQLAQRWPNFTPAALHLGVRGVFAFPLRAATRRIGVLTLYQDTAGVLTDEQVADSLVIAEVLAHTMVAIQSRSAPNVLAPDFRDAGSHRAEVHQASGMISVQLGVGVVEALARIRSHAYATERRVDAVAADIVARRLRLGDDRAKDGPE